MDELRPEMELVIHSSAGQAYATGRFMPRKPRDIDQFKPVPADAPSFADLQDELMRLEQLAVEAEAVAKAPPKKANLARSLSATALASRREPLAAERGAAADSGAAAAATARSAKPARASSLAGVATDGRAKPTASSPQPRHPAHDAAVARTSSQPPRSEAGHTEDVVVRCEDPSCRETLVLRAVRGKQAPLPPEGNWFCARCTNEAQGRGIRLFERVLSSRQISLGTRSVTQYLVKYWAHDDEDSEWLNHEEMQELELSRSGV